MQLGKTIGGQKMTKFSFKSTTFILLLVLTLLLTISPALAQDGANVYLQPVESADDTITVDVMVENISNMYGAEFRLRYDPEVLAAQDMIPDQNGMQVEVGTLLPIDKGFVVANKVDEATGEIVFAMTLLNPAPPAEGSGPLARVSFKVLQNSPTVLNVEHAKLVAADLQTIPSQTGSMNIGSAPAAAESSGESQSGAAPVTTIDMPPGAGSSSFPWWIIAVLVMVLGVLALGALIVMGGKSKATAKKSVPMKRATPTRQTPQQPVQQSMKQQPAARSRPSAFKQSPTPTDLSQK
jgi:hypothetical protein